MSATDVLEMELGRKAGNSCQLPVAGSQLENDSSQLPVAGSQFEAAGIESPQGLKPEAEADHAGMAEGAPLQSAQLETSEEEIQELMDFMSQETEPETPQTAREKRLAKRREKIEDQIGFMARWGVLLDSTNRNCPIKQGGGTYQVVPREYLMREKLKIRNKNGRLESLKANAVQRDYAETAAKRSIVLKARQLGITTYVAARFFLNCISRPGTMCVQVAHDQRSAEEIFRIVHRLLSNMPEVLRKGVLATSHANKKQIIFPHLDAIAGKDIVDAGKFQDGLGKVIDGVVLCLNASVWCK